ncbi:MAG TPA: aminotransferase class V-fold PLP-dependent enzyme [Gaiellaceae bacterium]|nr:aminotransferase class V-fold PLP-dependent enzyme [Gaiellaceae bacterium]
MTESDASRPDVPGRGVSVASCRSRFPIFERLTYVNSCSQGALSDAVRGAYDRYLTGWDERGAPWDYWVERTEAARATFARLVSAQPDDVAVTTSLSAGVSALASALDFGARPKVVVTDLEFPTIGQIWHAQELRGAEVVHVPADGPDIALEAFEQAIDERTALVSVTAVCYRNGARLPVEEIARIAHERGALVLLDAYQAIGTYPLDVRELGVDALAAGVLKYLLGSAGLGFLWCRPGLSAELLPTQTGWFADRDIFAMDITDYSPSDTARRFQSGTPPVPAIYAGVAGMELLMDIGIAETREHVNALNERLIAGVDDLGGIVVTPREAERRGALVCIRSTDAPELVRRLEADGVVTSERDGNLRVSAHAYNTVEDVDAVLAGLVRHRSLLVQREAARR